MHSGNVCDCHVSLKLMLHFIESKLNYIAIKQLQFSKWCVSAQAAMVAIHGWMDQFKERSCSRRIGTEAFRSRPVCYFFILFLVSFRFRTILSPEVVYRYIHHKSQLTYFLLMGCVFLRLLLVIYRYIHYLQKAKVSIGYTSRHIHLICKCLMHPNAKCTTVTLPMHCITQVQPIQGPSTDNNPLLRICSQWNLLYGIYGTDGLKCSPRHCHRFINSRLIPIAYFYNTINEKCQQHRL